MKLLLGFGVNTWPIGSFDTWLQKPHIPLHSSPLILLPQVPIHLICTQMYKYLELWAYAKIIRIELPSRGTHNHTWILNAPHHQEWPLSLHPITPFYWDHLTSYLWNSYFWFGHRMWNYAPHELTPFFLLVFYNLKNH